MSKNAEFKKGHNRARQAAEFATQDFHASLAPMKETIRSQGVNFGAVSSHLKKSAPIIFGTGMSKKDTLAWAVRKHAEDPDNFLKNIGFNKWALKTT